MQPVYVWGKLVGCKSVTSIRHAWSFMSGKAKGTRKDTRSCPRGFYTCCGSIGSYIGPPRGCFRAAPKKAIFVTTRSAKCSARPGFKPVWASGVHRTRFAWLPHTTTPFREWLISKGIRLGRARSWAVGGPSGRPGFGIAHAANRDLGGR